MQQQPRKAQRQFQSTPPQGGRLDNLRVPLFNDRFQSTPPQGGRPG